MNPFRLLSAIIGIVLAPVALGLFIGGIVLIVGYASLRDDAGYVFSPTYHLSSDSYAITSPSIDIATRPGDWLPFGLVDIRVETSPEGGKSVFFGIGPSDQVAAYLGGVSRDEVRRLVETDRITYDRINGAAPAGPPASQDFWALSSSTGNFQSVTWSLRSGDWSLVVMNADGSAGVQAAMRFGANVPLIYAIATGMIIGGLVLGGIATLFLIGGFRRPLPPPQPGVGQWQPWPAATPYPVLIEGRIDENLSRWMWLVKWFLAIPHLIIMAVLWAAFVCLTVIAFFAILFTGRYPHAIFEFNVGVMRWSWRVYFYAFAALATDRYPPFTLADDPTYPARLDVAYPEQLSRGLVLVKWWLLAIPHYIIIGLFTNGLVRWQTNVPGNSVLQIGGGIISILAFVAGVMLLVTAVYPRGIFDILMGLNRWVVRVAAYASLMRDEYPPFRLDLGGSEGGAPSSGPGATAPQ